MLFKFSFHHFLLKSYEFSKLGGLVKNADKISTTKYYREIVG